MENHIGFFYFAYKTLRPVKFRNWPVQYCLYFLAGRVLLALVSVQNSGPGFLVTLHHPQSHTFFPLVREAVGMLWWLAGPGASLEI